MLTIETPAADPTVISPAALRVAAGYAADDGSHDEDLAPIAARVTAEIATACDIAVGVSVDAAPPTLRRETLVETFRYPRRSNLVLSRRHQIEVISIDIDGEELDDVEFEVEPESGLLLRLADGRRRLWGGEMVTVTYEAGFDDIPADLDGAAADLVRTRLAETSRDAAVKSESVEVPDVLTQRTDYWVGAVPGSSSSGMPDDIFARLARFRTQPVG